MIFTTFQFAVFFAAVFPLFFALPRSWRYLMLLAASYYFYMCSIPWYITVIIVITLVDYAAGICIERSRSKRSRMAFLILSIVTNFGILLVFKYAAFFASNINDVFGLGLPVLRFILPLGISFHTFQAVSYTIEVYRGRCPAERNLVKYALYVAFFPQMVAGPIERPYNLLPQFHAAQSLSFDNFRAGMRQMLWGLFKKVAVADLVAPAVNTVYASPQQFSGPLLVLATFFFAVQIYCDFSGYSDIAIGSARMMGFRLMTNFRQPYFATSVVEFWHRWHISLSTWFRDYLYIPLGGNRVSPARHYANIMIVFLVSGLWHGANWTFAVWGGLHGLYLIIGSLTAGVRARAKAALGIGPSGPVQSLISGVFVFAIVTIAWVFFRAASVGDGLYIVTHFVDRAGFRPTDLFTLGLPRFEMAIALVLIGVVAATEWAMTHSPRLTALWSMHRSVRWAGYLACVFGVIFFGVFEGAEFIYFQF